MPAECSDEVLQGIAPAFRHYVQHVWKELEFGLCKNKVEVERIRTPCNEPSDQFFLVIPYCGKHVKWEVIFDRSMPWLAPDFRFDDDTFLLNADEEFLERHLPALHAWDPSDPRALSRLIAELMAVYREHQRKLLSEDDDSRAYFEYSALLGDGDAVTTERDVEVWVGHGRAAQFLIRLDVRAERLPEIFHDGWERNPGGECALLLVRYPNSNAAELVLSPLLSRALGDVALPPMHQTGVLMDYVPMVTELLNKKVETALVNARLKRELLSQLVVRYEGAVLEHDANSAAFLFQINDFYWILHVEIGDKFPETAPVLTLRSVYDAQRGRPRTKRLPACPYRRLDAYLAQQADIFRSECTAATSAVPAAAANAAQNDSDS